MAHLQKRPEDLSLATLIAESEKHDNAYPLMVLRGNEEAIVAVRNISCGDGTLNQENPPCLSASSNTSTYAYTVGIQFYENKRGGQPITAEAPLHFDIDREEAYCVDVSDGLPCIKEAQTARNATKPQNCLCLFRIRPLPKYRQMRAHFMIMEEDAMMAMKKQKKALIHQVQEASCLFCASSALFALTDVATPQFLSTLYHIPTGLKVPANVSSTQAVAEFYGEFYSNSDLTSFLQLSGLPLATLSSSNVYGDLPNNETNPGGEAQLDIEYIMALAPGATTSFYSIGTLNPYDSDNEGFLDYLYLVGNQSVVPWVHSLSYGDVEAVVFNSSIPGAAEYAQRCDAEFMKMGLRGCTVVFSSGDDGVGNFLIRDDIDMACSKAWPSWPASSPYVTTVGATQLSPQYLPLCQQSYDLSPQLGALPEGSRLQVDCTSVAETVCSSTLGGIITSGGGFSEVYSRNAKAPWQSASVERYLAHAELTPPAGLFNRDGRAYPDVSAYGSNYFVYLNGRIIRESGTSASAPVFASMVTLWNAQRLASKLAPLGFISPLLYQIAEDAPEAYHDITTGDIACGVGYSIETVPCCNFSFYATAGWDAATGLGTPNFQRIAQYIAAMETVQPPPPEEPTGSSVSVVGIVALVVSLLVGALSAYNFYVLYKSNQAPEQYGAVPMNP